jgi:hypothetical protein
VTSKYTDQSMPLPVAVAYFTRETDYAEAIQFLVASLKRRSMCFAVHSIPDLGDWYANTHYKADFLLGMIMRLKRPLLYLDADSIVHQEPSLLNDLDADIAVHYRRGASDAPKELLSGTIYLKPTPTTCEVLRRWININTARPNVWDQVNLQLAVQYTMGLRVVQLPPEYTFIFDLMRQEFPDARPVIEHFQASRRCRHKRYRDVMGFPLPGSSTTK